MKVSKSTIIRTAVLALVVLNMLLRQFGLHPIDIADNEIAMGIEFLIELAGIVCAWWYNNSFSEKALKAQQYLDRLRKEEMANV